MAQTAAQKAAEAALKKAREEAASRAGKTTAERLAEMKAEREKKLAEQKAARPTAKEAYETKQAEEEKARNLKFYEQSQKSTSVAGSGPSSILGSDITRWMIDPKTGKKRSTKEIVDAVVEAALLSENAPLPPGSYGNLDPITGKPRPLTPAQKVSIFLDGLMSLGERDKKNLSVANDVFNYLRSQKGPRGLTVNYLANKPENWEISKDSVGKILDRKYFDEPSSRKVFILDPTRNQLTPEEMKTYKEVGPMTLDPVTGFQVLVDDQGRYTLGQQPSPNGYTPDMDYSKYIPGVNEADYGMPSVNSDGTPINQTEDGSPFAPPGDPIRFDPVTGKPVTTTPLYPGTGTGTGSGSGLTGTQYNERMSVYSAMADRFNKYGLTGLAEKIKQLAIQGATEATITLQLQDTPEYQQRFAANADRIKKGLAALTPAEYVNIEDSYRQVLRAYGLKQFDNDAYVRQFISNDMSPTELSNRVVTAVQRVQNADPALVSQLKQFYGIGASDMVAYVLDPEQQFQKIERQIAASEIGVAAGRQGLRTGVSVAEQLAAQGVTEAEARKGYSTIADILPTAEKLSDIYGTTLDDYRQDEAEQEVFNSLASAQRKRQRLTAREVASFGGASGINRTSLTAPSVGQF